MPTPLHSITTFFSYLVHPRARCNAFKAPLHAAFIAAQLFTGLIASIAVLVYVASAPSLHLQEFLALSWCAVPFALAYGLSVNGRLARASGLSALGFAGAIIVLASSSGAGGASFVFAAAWLSLVALELCLGGVRPVSLHIQRPGIVRPAVLLGFVALAVILIVAGALFWTQPAVPGATAGALPVMEAAFGAIYAAGLCLRVWVLHYLSRTHVSRERWISHLGATYTCEPVTVHDSSGRVLYASAAARSGFGAAPSTLLGEGLLQRIGLQDRPRYLQAIRAMIETGAGETFVCRVHRHANGDEDDPRQADTWMRVSVQQADALTRQGVEKAATAGDCCVLVWRDITAHRRLQHERDEAKAQIARMEEENRTMLANVTHELRTPLNAIIGFSELLERGLKKEGFVPEVHGDYLSIVQYSGQNLLQSITDILNLSKIESGHFDTTYAYFDVVDLARSCVAMLDVLAQSRGVRLHATFDDTQVIPRICADQGGVRQIMINLIDNAIKYTARGGRVDVSLERTGHCVHFSVCDTGIGMSAQEMQDIGKPFTRTADAQAHDAQGCGLGLAIVKGLVRMHRGVLNFDSQKGQGTKATVVLPMDQQVCRPDDIERNRRVQCAKVVSGAFVHPERRSLSA